MATDEHATPPHLTDGRVSVAARLDRLPWSSWHRNMLLLLMAVFAFEFVDLYTFSTTAPAMEKFLHMTIADIADITSAVAIGTAVGAFFASWLADRIGRKSAVLIMTISYSAFSLLNAAISGVGAFEVVRFLTGVGYQGMNVVGLVILTELFQKQYRGRVQAFCLGVSLTLGVDLLVWLAWAIVPYYTWAWRVIYLLGGLGLIGALLLYRYLPESPRWLERKGRLAEADTVMAEIEAKVMHARGEASLPAPAEVLGSLEEVDRTVTLGALTRAGYLRRFVVLSILWIIGVVAFFGYFYWVGVLLKLHGFTLSRTLLSVAIIYTVGNFGALAAALTVDRVQRKHGFAVIAVLIAAASFSFAFINASVLIVTLGCVLAFLFQMSVPYLYSYSPEIFPTKFRSTASGWANGLSRITNIFGPQIIALLITAFAFKATFYFVGSLVLANALVMLVWGTRTRQMSVESINEAKLLRTAPVTLPQRGY